MIAKVGVSGGKIRKDGKSYRAESQVRKWNDEAGHERYRSRIIHREPAGPGARDNVLEVEKEKSELVQNKGGLDKDKHKRPIINE